MPCDHPRRAQKGWPTMIGMKGINKHAESVKRYEHALENRFRKVTCHVACEACGPVIIVIVTVMPTFGNM
jgi:hypothetical protein